MDVFYTYKQTKQSNIRLSKNKYNKFIMLWTSMFKWATFREILLPSLPDDGRSISRNVAHLKNSDCSKLAKNPKIDNDVTIFRHDVIGKIFWRFFVSLAKFSYDSGIMTIFFKGLAKNPEIGNICVWVLPNIWRLGQIMDIKFGTNVFNRM